LFLREVAFNDWFGERHSFSAECLYDLADYTSNCFRIRMKLNLAILIDDTLGPTLLRCARRIRNGRTRGSRLLFAVEAAKVAIGILCELGTRT